MDIRQLVKDTSPKSDGGPMHFLDLNDDCLREICNALDFKACVAFAGACRRTQMIAREIYLKKYKDIQELRIHRYNYVKLHTNGTVLEIENFGDVLRHFGDLMLKIDRMYLRWEDERPLVFDKLLPLFKIAEELSIQGGNINLFPFEACERLSKLWALTLDGTNLHRCSTITFPKLKEIYINLNVPNFDEIEIVKFIEKHPHLTEYRFYLSSVLIDLLLSTQAANIHRPTDDAPLMDRLKPLKYLGIFESSGTMELTRFINILAHLQKTIDALRYCGNGSSTTDIWTMLPKFVALRILYVDTLEVFQFSFDELTTRLGRLIDGWPHFEFMRFVFRMNAEYANDYFHRQFQHGQLTVEPRGGWHVARFTRHDQN